MKAWFSLLTRRRWLILVIVVAGVLGGLVNLRGLSIDAVPDISPEAGDGPDVSPGPRPAGSRAPRQLPDRERHGRCAEPQGVRSTVTLRRLGRLRHVRRSADMNQARTQVNQRLQQASENDAGQCRQPADRARWRPAWARSSSSRSGPRPFADGTAALLQWTHRAETEARRPASPT